MQTFNFPFYTQHWFELMQTLYKEFTNSWQNTINTPNEWKENIEKTKTSFEKIFNSYQEKMNSNDQQTSGNPFLKTYHEGCNSYLSFLLKVYLTALEAMDERFSSLSNDKDFQHSLSDTSKVWLESCERTYDQMINNPEFQKLYGNIVNTWGKWKFHTP